MINIMPKPDKVTECEGTLMLNKQLSVNYQEPAKKAVNLLGRFFDVRTDENNPDITFISEYGNKTPGSYKLEINDKICIYSSSESGFLYAAESLRQMLPCSIEQDRNFNSAEISKCVIEDSPRYQYRGFMLDSCRHFFKKEFVMKKLDEMALLKLNKFHFHLSDDQGWRIDLPDYPKLKEISSVRARTKIDGRCDATEQGIYEEKPYGGIYSVEDLKEIVAYAETLCIDVIPEIDSPGHISALLAAYPEFSCKGRDIKVEEGGGVFKNLLCVGNDDAVNFITGLIDEIAEIFPSRHFHIGGDEAPLDALEKCPKCRTKMQREGFKSTLELKLDYTNKLAAHLKEKGYQVTGWNEVVNPGYPKDAYIQLWAPTGTKKAVDAVNEGQQVIDSTFFDFYLDYTYSLNTLKQSYMHNPAKLFKSEAQNNVAGVESCLWTEWIRDEQRANWQMYPRLCATAETGWSRNENKNFEDFVARLDEFTARLNALGVTPTSKECYLHAKKKSVVFYFLSRRIPSNIEYKKYHG